MNNRITRMIANTVGLAAVAALGITVYQLVTTPVKEKEPKNQPLIQEDGTENTNE